MQDQAADIHQHNKKTKQQESVHFRGWNANMSKEGRIKQNRKLKAGEIFYFFICFPHTDAR